MSISVRILPFTAPGILVQGVETDVDVPLKWSNKAGAFNDWWYNVTFQFKIKVDYIEVSDIYISAADIGMQDVRNGQHTFTIPLPTNMTIGEHHLNLTGWLHAAYMWDDGHASVLFDSDWSAWDVEVIEATPLCSFTADRLTGEAPLVVNFTDTSEVPPEAPIRAWNWGFGDGTTSGLQNPAHTFQREGSYTVTLTVTNDYGSDSASTTITVFAAPVNPYIVPPPESWFPASVKVDEPFTPRLIIRNQGGAGEIYIGYLVEGRDVILAEAQPIPAYQDYDVPLGTHSIDWYLGYVPDQSKYVNLTFYTGPVGKPRTSQYSFTIGVVVAGVEPPPDEEEEEGKFPWAYILGGLAAIGAATGLILHKRSKR